MTESSGIDADRAARLARRGAGCVTLFALPFLAVGVFAAVELVRGLMGDNASGMPPGFAAIFALAFGGSAIAMIAAVRYGARRAAADAHRRAQSPAEPWLWRDDWAAGRADSGQRAGATAIAVFAFLWNVISAPVLFVVPDEVVKGNTAALIGLLFPIVGVGLIIWAVRMAVRSRKYRGTSVELGVVPIVPGATFEGTLHARFANGAPENVSLTLSCIRRRVTGSGNNRNVSERVLWQDQRSIESWDIAVDFGEARVPFAFELPAAAPSTTPGSGNDRVLWRLDAHAQTTGVDYAESFELPVYATDPAAHVLPDGAALDALESALVVSDSDAPPSAPEEPTILIRPADPAGTEFFSTPGRNRAPLLPLVVFLAVWFGFVAMMLRLGAPLLFPIVFGGVGMIVLLFAIDLAFATTRTVVTEEGVTVRTQALGIGQTRHIARPEVRTVGVKVGMSQGQSATQTAKAWHDVVLHADDGAKVLAARHIPTRVEAEWVAAELRRAIGLA